MRGDYGRFLRLPPADRRDVFDAAADRLDTLPSYVEKDFWVCLVLDVLFNGLPQGHPQLLFKGGTALSKAFSLINRFSEDIDLVVSREGLGFGVGRDPTRAPELSGKLRKALFEDLRAACSDYVTGDLAAALGAALGNTCDISVDPDDTEGQTLLITYPTLYPSADVPYVLPRVKLEAGARSALEPSKVTQVAPYIATELSEQWSFEVANLHVLDPARTYLEKLLILHGLHCGFRDDGRIPSDRDRISRHYYDVAMITQSAVGQAALANKTLLTSVREHNLIAFRQAWKRFEEAVPGTLLVTPQGALRKVIEKDYTAMQGMMLGEAPDFAWVISQLEIAERQINDIKSA